MKHNKSNLIYCFAGTISSPLRGTQCAKLTKIISYKESRGAFKVSVPGLWVRPRGKRLSWEARVEKVGFEVFPERCDRGTVSYMERERVPKNWGVVTKRI